MVSTILNSTNSYKRRRSIIRKLVIDGYVIKLEIPELKEILHQLGPIGNNVNQMARKLNAGGSIYREDIAEVNAKLDAIYTQLEKILKRLSKIK